MFIKEVGGSDGSCALILAHWWIWTEVMVYPGATRMGKWVDVRTWTRDSD